MPDALTVDTLPIDLNQDFAIRDATFEPYLVEDAKYVPNKIELNVSEPQQSALDLLWEVDQCYRPFATIEPPPYLREQSARFFMQKLIHGIDPEHLEELFLSQMEEENEEEVILPLLTQLKVLQRLLNQIRSEMRRFQKA